MSSRFSDNSVAVAAISPPAGETPAWGTVQVLVLAAAFLAAVVAGLSWTTGAIEPFVNFQIGLLLVLMVLLNLAPAVLELAWRRFDPFDAKHAFLAYFFLVLTAQSVDFVLGSGGNPAFATPEADASLVVKTLSAILLGLSAFVAGCYLPAGRMVARLLPRLPEAPATRIRLVALLGGAGGVFAFWQLMKSASGVRSFLVNLGSWRTAGVLEGVGYLTFPIAVVLPASALLLMIHTTPPPGKKNTWAALGTTLVAVASLLPLLVLGFRGALVPAMLQILVAWHYGRRAFTLRGIFICAVILLAFLSVYGVARGVVGGEQRTAGDIRTAVLGRIPGFQTVERVIWRMEQGEPHRGVRVGLVEASVILVPRSLWAGKPRPASLDFADIFFFDFFLARGDPLDGVRSGVSPTLIGELMWTRGLPGVVGGSFLLGVFAALLVAWRQRARGARLSIFVYALFMTWLPLFVEAPQNTLNTFVMLLVLCLGMCLVLTAGLSRKKIRR